MTAYLVRSDINNFLCYNSRAGKKNCNSKKFEKPVLINIQSMPKVVDWYHFSYHDCLRFFFIFLSFRDDPFYHISRTIYNTIYLFKINLPPFILSSFFSTCFTHQEIGPQISKFLFLFSETDFTHPWNSDRGAKWSDGIETFHRFITGHVTGMLFGADRMNFWSRFNNQDFGSDLVRYSNWLCFDLLMYLWIEKV